ncbi:hypothetical protein BKA80DRAFT_286782 [Phyllosticta citrichinensis]
MFVASLHCWMGDWQKGEQRTNGRLWGGGRRPRHGPRREEGRKGERRTAHGSLLVAGRLAVPDQGVGRMTDSVTSQLHVRRVCAREEAKLQSLTRMDLWLHVDSIWGPTRLDEDALFAKSVVEDGRGSRHGQGQTREKKHRTDSDPEDHLGRCNKRRELHEMSIKTKTRGLSGLEDDAVQPDEEGSLAVVRRRVRLATALPAT